MDAIWVYLTCNNQMLSLAFIATSLKVTDKNKFFCERKNERKKERSTLILNGTTSVDINLQQNSYNFKHILLHLDYMNLCELHDCWFV